MTCIYDTWKDYFIVYPTQINFHLAYTVEQKTTENLPQSNTWFVMIIFHMGRYINFGAKVPAEGALPSISVNTRSSSGVNVLTTLIFSLKTWW